MLRHSPSIADFLCVLSLTGVVRASALRKETWPIKFRQNAQTLPSIEVKLSPPDDPLPQVTAEVLLLERSRLELEEGLMAKLEDEYNAQLDSAQTQISEAVERAMSTFSNPDIIQGAIRGAMQPRSGEGVASKSQLVRFRQTANGPVRAGTPVPPDTMNAVDIGGAGHFTSFLQTKETTRSHSKIIGDILGAAFAPPPAVKLQLTEVKEPDPQIKEKMDEIEQLRTDEETKMFEQAMAEFAQLTRITVAELEKNIQIQLNPFLVDKQAIRKAVQMATTKASSYSPTPLAFRQAEGNASRGVDKKTRSMASFLQLGSSASSSQQTKFGLTAEKQLNVKIAQSEKPYPTVDEIVSDMQNKRDATERLERMKILQLQLKLLRAEGEMVKEALHTSVARVLAQFAPAIEAIRAETAARALE